MSIVKSIVSREHVSRTNRQIIRRIYNALTKEGRKPENKNLRKKYYREALECHKANQDLYYMVNTGGWK